MAINSGLFTSASCHWSTPAELYADLDGEFHFNDDPCPLHSQEDGLSRAWGSRTYCNPPYGRKDIKIIQAYKSGSSKQEIAKTLHVGKERVRRVLSSLATGASCE